VLVTAADPASANHTGSNGYFIFQNSGVNAGEVFWDPTGGNGSDAIGIAKLTGLTLLLASDFHIV